MQNPKSQIGSDQETDLRNSPKSFLSLTNSPTQHQKYAIESWERIPIQKEKLKRKGHRHDG